jgi:hypothetical protein
MGSVIVAPVGSAKQRVAVAAAANSCDRRRGAMLDQQDLVVTDNRALVTNGALHIYLNTHAGWERAQYSM